MQLTLIRHLPTDWNKQGLLQGSRDIELSEITPDWKKDIFYKKKILDEKEPFDVVLASSLKRTQQTANLYGYSTFKIEPLLNELDFGSFEGKEKSLLVNTYHQDWTHCPKKLVLGESLNHFEKRIITFLDEYTNFSNLLIFGHGSWIRAIISLQNTGSINDMNKVAIGNNELISVKFSKLKIDGINLR